MVQTLHTSANVTGPPGALLFDVKPVSYNLYYSRLSNILLSGQFYDFTVYMLYVNSIVNPFVYAIQYHEFQERIKELFLGKPAELDNSIPEGTHSNSAMTNK